MQVYLYFECKFKSKLKSLNMPTKKCTCPSSSVRLHYSATSGQVGQKAGENELAIMD